jgi:hypothetical protein
VHVGPVAERHPRLEESLLQSVLGSGLRSEQALGVDQQLPPVTSGEGVKGPFVAGPDQRDELIVAPARERP